MSQRIAHLSDLHVLAARGPRSTTGDALRTRFVSFGRSLDAASRARKVLRAVATAKERGATHFVFSGDLTELGTEAQFEALAELLHEAGLDPDSVTLVPGNHDAYSAPDAWRRALAGPLAAFRRASAGEHGKVVDVGAALVLPVDVACHQPVGRAAGELSDAAADVLEQRVRDLSRWGRPIVVALHHPPLPHAWRAWQWVDGLRGHVRLVELLRRFEGVFVLHGHLHYAVEKAVGACPRPRVFGATATVDDAPDAPRVRLYDVDAVLASRRAA